MKQYLNIGLIYAVGKIAVPMRLGIVAFVTPEDFYRYGLLLLLVSICGLLNDPGLSVYRLSQDDRSLEAYATSYLYILTSIILLFYATSLLLIARETYTLEIFAVFGAIITNVIINDIRVECQKKNIIQTYVYIEQLGAFFILISTYISCILGFEHIAIYCLLFVNIGPLILIYRLKGRIMKFTFAMQELKKIYTFCRGIVINKALFLVRKNLEKFTVPVCFSPEVSGQLFFSIMVCEAMRLQLNNIFAVRFEGLIHNFTFEEVQKEYARILYLVQSAGSVLFALALIACKLILVFQPTYLSQWIDSIYYIMLYIILLPYYAIVGPFNSYLQVAYEHKTLNDNQLWIGIGVTLMLASPGLFLSDATIFLIGLIFGTLAQRLHLLYHMRRIFQMNKRQFHSTLIMPGLATIYWLFEILNENSLEMFAVSTTAYFVTISLFIKCNYKSVV